MGQMLVAGLDISGGWGTGGYKVIPGAARPWPRRSRTTTARTDRGIRPRPVRNRRPDRRGRRLWRRALMGYRLEKGGTSTGRSRSIFRWNGGKLPAFAGDTIASALLANDVAIVGRGMKLHRPRGVFAIGAEEPNALVALGRGAELEPSARATMIPGGRASKCARRTPGRRPFRPRPHARPHRRPLARGLLPQAFKWPSWDFWERWVRRTAGIASRRANAIPRATTPQRALRPAHRRRRACRAPRRAGRFAWASP